MVIDKVCRSGLIRDMAGLAGNPFHVTWREGMFISGCFLILTLVMAVLTRMHCVVEVIPYSLL